MGTWSSQVAWVTGLARTNDNNDNEQTHTVTRIAARMRLSQTQSKVISEWRFLN